MFRAIVASGASTSFMTTMWMMVLPHPIAARTLTSRHEGVRREVRLDGESGSRPLPSLRMPSSVQGLHGSK